MKTTLRSRVLSWLLIVTMVLTMVPTAAFATEPAPLADHVVINQAYGGGGNKGAEYKNDFVELYNPTKEDVDLTGWTIQYASTTGKFEAGANKVYQFTDGATIKAESFYLIQFAAGSGGTKDLPTPDAIGEITMGGKGFKLALVKDTELIANAQAATVVDFLGAGAANEYEGSGPLAGTKLTSEECAVRLIDGVDTDDNAADFQKAAPNPRNSGEEGSVTPPSSEPAQTETGSEPSVPSAVTIAEALAGAKDTAFTVKGVVTLVDGQNIYVQDATGAICVRMNAEPADLTLGDVIIGTGKRAEFNGTPQLGNGTYEKSNGIALNAKLTTIDALTQADICTYVQMKNLTVTDVFDKNGEFKNPNITLEDANGNSIQIYKAVAAKNEDGTWAVKAGDVVDVKAAVGYYAKDGIAKFQLRNTLASEVTLAQAQPGTDPETDPETDPGVDGTVTIAEALAGEKDTEFTVKGVVTMVEDQNIYVQDGTGAICVRMSAKPADLTLGDVIIGTGKRAEFNGTPQLGNGTYEKSNGIALNAKLTTIDALTQTDICSYVQMKNLTVTKVDDNNGKFSNPNITLEDANGNSIQIYKAVAAKNEDGTWAVKAGDVVDVKAAVGYYAKDGIAKFQLRNTLASEITPAQKEGFVTELHAGDQVVIVNPANNKALSAQYKGFYNTALDVAVEGGKLTGYTADEVWTVGVNADGTYTFSTADGKKLAMGEKFSSMPLDEVNPNWEISAANTADCFYVKNTGRNAYMEYFADKGTWSGFGKISPENEGLFAQKFYLVTEIPGGNVPGGDDILAEGSQVAIYNLDAKAVISLQNDNAGSPALTSAPAVITEDKLTAENGGVIFTVEKNGEYYRFKNEAFGYLCSNGTGNNAFYSQTASEDADWKLAAKNSGYTMESRTAKFQGKYPQFMEYFSESFKTYSTNKVENWDIFTFQFYPVTNTNLTQGVVNAPQFVAEHLPEAYIGADYKAEMKADFVFGVDETSLTCNYDFTYAEGVLTVTIPAAKLDAFKEAGKLDVVLSGKDTKGVEFTQTVTVTVKDEPVVVSVEPAPNSETGKGNLRPVISAVLANIGENAQITMTVNEQSVETVMQENVVTYTPAEDMAEGRTNVSLTVTRADGKTVTKNWSFTVGEAQFQLYFGQLHAHTAEYSDGAGTLQEGLDYVKALPESANVDFISFTDHSNYFDTKSAAIPEQGLYDMSLASAEAQKTWAKYKDTVAAFNAENNGIVAIAGFEMTWSGGPGHINTFNTPGIVSRNNTVLNNKTDDAGMRAYYSLLCQPEGENSLNQFNHPGKTFGNFKDFNYWDPIIDTRMHLVEVGNGEGQIGAGGYYPSYEQYIMALDKGWHLAPSNNQDNHKGRWGNANDARDVILTDDFSEQGLYDAIRQYRVYATEDKNLEIHYTMNGQQLGSIIEEVPEKLNLNVQVYDPDDSDSILKVEVVVNSGKTAYVWDNQADIAKGELTCQLDPEYSYYFIRVTQSDGDLAVTAPVWVGETLKLGINDVQSSTRIPVTGEATTLTTTIFNSESQDATVKSVTYTANGSEVLGVQKDSVVIPASSTKTVEWEFTPTKAKLTTIKVTVVLEQDGKEYTFSKDIELDVKDAEKLVYVGIDAAHHNEYVAGNYKDSMGNFANLAADYSVRTVELNTSEDLVAACSNDKYKMLVLTVPSRRDGDAIRNPYENYTDEEISAIVAFNKAGGTVVLCGWSDYYEHYSPFEQADHMAAQQNRILTALGSSLRIGDDATVDDEYNGGQSQRLYFNTYNMDSFLMDGVEVDPEHPHDKLYTERFSQYGGASVYAVDAEGNVLTELPATVTPVVYGHATTNSKDSDLDGVDGKGTAEMVKYPYAEGDNRLMVLGTEQLDGQGLIVVSGAAFMSNFEVQAKVEDNAAEKNYSNYKICENLVEMIHPMEITDIADVRAQTDEGYSFIIEGTVTANASGHDKNTAFFDCTYIQDTTAGINVFPVAGDYKIGDVVRISGVTSAYQGEPQLAVKSITKIGAAEDPVEPVMANAKEFNDRAYEGSLVTLSGVVTDYTMSNGLVESIYVKDDSNDVARVFIDGYITKDKVIENLAVGSTVTATGLASYDNTYAIKNDSHARLRIRDRADIVCVADPGAKLPFTDVSKDSWYYDYVVNVYENGIMDGMTETLFQPQGTTTRGQIVTMLYRMAGEPAVEGTCPFTDVASGRYYTDAILWASTNGIAKGMTAELFRPEGKVTREQMVTFLWRYAAYNGEDVTANAVLSVFVDADQIHNYALGAMKWAVANHIIDGLPGNKLEPQGRATRAQMAAVMSRM